MGKGEEVKGSSRGKRVVRLDVNDAAPLILICSHSYYVEEGEL